MLFFIGERELAACGPNTTTQCRIRFYQEYCRLFPAAIHATTLLALKPLGDWSCRMAGFPAA
jgi:hypothetical protein